MRKYTFVLIALSAIFSFTSCGIKYHRPEIEEEKLVRYGNDADTTFDISTIHWKDYYKDTLLCELIDSALVKNYDLQTAMYRVEQAAAYFKQSKWAIAPDLGVGVSAAYGGAGTDHAPEFNFGLNLSWEIDIWGKLSKAKKSKYQALLASSNTRNLIQTQLIANVASLYYSLIALDFNRNFVIETIENREDYLSTVKDLKNSAQVNEVAVLQADAQLMSAKAYLPELDYNIQELENQICYLIGETPRPIEKNTASLAEVIGHETFKLDSIGMPSLLLRNRPDILSAENMLVSKLENYNSARAALYPSLRLTGNVATDATAFSQWFAMPASLIWNILGGLTEPIFNGRALRTQRDIAEKDMEIAVNEFKSTVMKAGMEVSNLLSKRKANTERLEYKYRKFIQLSKAYEYSVELLKNGYATYLDVLSAQEGAFDAQIDLTTCLKEYITTQIELYRALGGGWDHPQEKSEDNPIIPEK